MTAAPVLYRHRYAPAAALGLLLLTAGCANTPLSGAGQMRIDVDVYKGPLSKEPEVQWQELRGLIEDAKRTFDVVEQGMLHLARARFTHSGHGILTRSPGGDMGDGMTEWCTLPQKSEIIAKHDSPPDLKFDSFKSLLDSWEARDKFRAAQANFEQQARKARNRRYQRECLRLKDIFNDAKSLKEEIEDLRSESSKWTIAYTAFKKNSSDLVSNRMENLTGTDRTEKIQQLESDIAKAVPPLAEGIRAVTSETSRIAARLKTRAAYWAATHVTSAMEQFQIRQMQTSLSFAAAEIANQLGSRADTLLKQLAPDGNDRQELPLSVHLRDASPTKFLDLYLWQHAINGQLPEESAIGTNYRLNRLRVFESLYEDDNWNRVNTVHATGRGEIRMAFIKDEIGNWNLKNFDNDPTELLDAYQSAGLAALRATTTLLSGGAGGLSGAQRLLALGNQIALGGAPASAPALGNKTVEQLHQGVVDRLARLRADMVTKRTTLTEEIDKLDGTVTTREGSVNEKEEAITTEQGKLPDNKGSEAHSADARAQKLLAALLRKKVGETEDETRKAELTGQAEEADKAAAASENKAKEADAVEAKITTLESELAPLKTDRDDAVKERDKKESELDTLTKSTTEQAALILERHSAIITELEAATVDDSGSGTPSVPTPIGSNLLPVDSQNLTTALPADR